MINLEEIKKRLEDLKKENDKVNEQFKQLEITRNQLIQEALIRNGRILELEELLKEIID